MKCSICTQTVSLEQMHKDGRTKSGYSDVCESCFDAASKERKRGDKRRYRQNPEYKAKYRDWQLRKFYGLTAEQFDFMLAAQGGVCASCGANSPRWAKGWCVDHDHSCCATTPTCGNCVRGILCMPCNMAVGIMKESISDLISVASYLAKCKGPHYTEADVSSVLGL